MRKKYWKILKNLILILIFVSMLGGFGAFVIYSLHHTGVERPPAAVRQTEVDGMPGAAGVDEEKEDSSLLSRLSKELSQTRENEAQSEADRALCRITILDVGQGSCALIESNGEYMLYDGGDRDTSSYLVAFLKNRNIHHIKYLVASHYHADHVFGLIGVIESGITYDALIAPDYATSVYAKQALFERVASDKWIVPYVSQTFQIGEIEAVCIAPAGDAYSDDNGYSIGLKFTMRELSILIDGDATEESETDMTQSGIDLSSDILIVPHHGSSYSSTSAWLESVGAGTAVISCGLDNEYGHPHSATLDRLKAAGVKNLYRTDLCGNVVIRYQSQPPYFQIECDRQPDETVWNAGSGKEGADKELSDYWQSDGEKEDYYIGNTKSRKFHRPSCSQLPGEKNRVLFATREDAMKEKYAPCGACNP